MACIQSTETKMKSVWLDTVTIKTIMTLTQYAWIIKVKSKNAIPQKHKRVENEFIRTNFIWNPNDYYVGHGTCYIERETI